MFGRSNNKFTQTSKGLYDTVNKTFYVCLLGNVFLTDFLCGHVHKVETHEALCGCVVEKWVVGGENAG